MGLWTSCRRLCPFRRVLFLTIAALLSVNLLALVYMQSSTTGPEAPRERPPIVTVVIRDFMFFRNNVPGTVAAVNRALPSAKVLVVSRGVPYPPIELSQGSHATFVNVAVVPGDNHTLHRAETFITTPYTLVLPDNVFPSSDADVVAMVKTLEAHAGARAAHADRGVRIAAAQVVAEGEDGRGGHSGALCKCQAMDFDVRRWTLTVNSAHGAVLPSPVICGAVRCATCLRQAPILLATRDLLALDWDAYDRMTSEAIFAQASARNWKVALHESSSFAAGTPLFDHDEHLKWKANRDFTNSKRAMNARLGIKLVVESSGVGEPKREFFGCNRKGPRCFGTVVDDAPEFLYAGRWTPPCCLHAIRTTGRHVINRLEEAGVRYWLEGGTLLGAMRSGDIIPWDYDMDIGIFEDDIARLPELAAVRKLAKGGTKTFDGFVWENAREGAFFRVQYSEANHLHVDLWPFRERASDGMMTKDTWMATHRQDMEFPSHFLKPLHRMEFIGIEVSVPNNARAFLELKFGPGVIENPRFPGGAEHISTG